MMAVDITGDPMLSVPSPHVVDKELDELVDVSGTTGDKEWAATREEANRAEEFEHSLSFLKAAKMYKAVGGEASFRSVMLIPKGCLLGFHSFAFGGYGGI
jgi:hypothetical protein